MHTLVEQWEQSEGILKFYYCPTPIQYYRPRPPPPSNQNFLRELGPSVMDTTLAISILQSGTYIKQANNITTIQQAYYPYLSMHTTLLQASMHTTRSSTCVVLLVVYIRVLRGTGLVLLEYSRERRRCRLFTGPFSLLCWKEHSETLPRTELGTELN